MIKSSQPPCKLALLLTAKDMSSGITPSVDVPAPLSSWVALGKLPHVPCFYVLLYGIKMVRIEPAS